MSVVGVEFGVRAREVMRARSGGRCEGCGRVARLEAHHRLFRSRGGLGGAANGLLLCGLGNAAGCHGIAHSDVGTKLGWSVSSGGSAEAVSVWLYRFQERCLLTDSGLVLAAKARACWKHSSEFPLGVPGCGRCRLAGRVLWSVDDERGWVA